MINLCEANVITGTAAEELKNKKAMAGRVWTALNAYRQATSDPYRLEEITEKACRTIAIKAWDAKANLRDILRHHPNWDEETQEIVIDVQRSIPVDWGTIANAVKNYAINLMDWDRYSVLRRAILLIDPDYKDTDFCLEAYRRLTGHEFRPGRKATRVIREILIASGTWDDTAGSTCQSAYAAWSNAISHATETIALHLSIDPAILLTISNPKKDKRDDTLVSCHSLNNRNYHYSAGNGGYATDEVTMCLYTCVKGDPYTRKTSRQLYMYSAGTLLQSRMYNCQGATYGPQDLTTLYRQTVRDIISDCLELDRNRWADWENGANHRALETDRCFGGYPDYTYNGFDINICHTASMSGYSTLHIGAAPICISCGRTCGTRSLRHRGAVCIECDRPGYVCCCCDDSIDPNEVIYDRNGNMYCESCAYDRLAFCDECEEYVDVDDITEVYTSRYNSRYICSNCLDNGNYICCPCCDRWIATDI